MPVWLLYAKQSAGFSAGSKSLRSSMHSHDLRQIALKDLRQIILKTTGMTSGSIYGARSAANGSFSFPPDVATRVPSHGRGRSSSFFRHLFLSVVRFMLHLPLKVKGYA
jgi:hypothetical protein